jgi:hypothetical protein
MPSIYHDHADAYREQGLAVIPCVPGDKFPGKFAGGKWWAENKWQRYCDRLPTDFEVQIWDRWPDAGICLALGASSAPAGKILVAIDIDTDVPDEVAAIRSVLPGSPVAKRGAKGETQFYLANPCVLNRRTMTRTSGDCSTSWRTADKRLCLRRFTRARASLTNGSRPTRSRRSTSPTSRYFPTTSPIAWAKPWRVRL